MKTIENLWLELETEVASKASAKDGLMSRLTTADTGQRLLIAVEWPSRCRLLLFRATKEELPPRQTWPECQGLELSFEDWIAGGPCLVVRLREARHGDVFGVLAEDLARRIISGPERDAARRVLGALGRWQKFLANGGRALSDEARRGLWGELWALEHLMVESVGIEPAVQSWRGPLGSAQDFQLDSLAIEIKSSAAKPPLVVQISSEFQLHEGPWAHLFLCHLAIDEQEGAGQSLPDRIGILRTQVQGTAVEELMEDLLLEAGWTEREAELHVGHGFQVRETTFMVVKDGFPRITPTILPKGIGQVDYSLALDGLVAYHVTSADVKNLLDKVMTLPTTTDILPQIKQ